MRGHDTGRREERGAAEGNVIRVQGQVRPPRVLIVRKNHIRIIASWRFDENFV